VQLTLWAICMFFESWPTGGMGAVYIRVGSYLYSTSNSFSHQLRVLLTFTKYTLRTYMQLITHHITSSLVQLNWWLIKHFMLSIIQVHTDEWPDSFINWRQSLQTIISGISLLFINLNLPELSCNCIRFPLQITNQSIIASTVNTHNDNWPNFSTSYALCL